jgi:hypothetical protein
MVHGPLRTEETVALRVLIEAFGLVVACQLMAGTRGLAFVALGDAGRLSRLDVMRNRARLRLLASQGGPAPIDECGRHLLEPFFCAVRRSEQRAGGEKKLERFPSCGMGRGWPEEEAHKDLLEVLRVVASDVRLDRDEAWIVWSVARELCEELGWTTPPQPPPPPVPRAEAATTTEATNATSGRTIN